MPRANRARGEATAAEAFAIADSAMTDQLMSHCLLTAHSDRLLLCDENGKKVTTLDAADSAIREAFSWLERRGSARLRQMGEDVVIILGERSNHAG